MMKTTKSPFDFRKIEQVRYRLMLNKREMAKIFKVSRQTYHAWTKGQPIQDGRLPFVKGRLRILLNELQNGWFSPETLDLSKEDRFRKLLEIINK